MEKIEYREAVFDVIRTISFERTRVKDEANNYLHTHVDCVVEVNWQPALVSYGLVEGIPFAQPGNMPGETDLALLTRLLQPRGLLRITAGNSVILETPGIVRGMRLQCDVKEGPSCEMVGVPLMIGIRHWVVTLHFVADVRDFAPSGSDTNAIISNLWVSTEDIDFQRRSTRRFAGRAILRADVMRQNNVNANSFRDLYLFRCPDHYQRQNVRVQLSEDGTVCEWSFEDVMRGYDLGVNSPIVDIECYRTGYITKGSPAKAAVDFFRNAAQAIAFMPAMILNTQMDNLPKYFIQCRCDLTGDRNADLGNLSRIALGVCVNQLAVAGINAALTGTTEMIFRQDIADRVYTSVEMTIRLSDDALIAAGIVVSPIQTLKGILADNDAAAAALTPGSNAMLNQFQRNSTTLSAGPVEGLGLVADRSGLPAFKRNPPLRQGAFGVIPGNLPGAPTLGTVPGEAGAIPTGGIPDGIENLIVQALLGQNQVPPQPPALVNQS